MGQAKVERCEVQIMRKQEFTNLLIQLGPPIFSAIVSARDFRFGLRRFFLTGRPLERKMLQPLEQSATRSGYRSWMLVPYRCRPICHVRQNGRTGPLLRRCLKYFQMRSEEHTSELQSLMRISYAVFCLKKKSKKYKQHTIYITLYV